MPIKKAQRSTRYGHGTIARSINGRWDASIYLPDGRRRARLATLDEAKAWLDAQDPGDSIALTASQLRDAKTALALLPEGATLTQAAQTLAQLAEEKSKAVDLIALAQTYLDAKRKTLRSATLGTYRRQLNALLPELRQPITRAAIEARLADKTPHARNTAVRSLSAFFAWCVATGALDRNPADGLRLARVAEPTRTILTIDQTRALLAHAQAQALLDAAAASPYADLLPYIAVSLFAGLRPTEAMRLTTADIGEEYITLDAAQTKTAHARTVRIRPNLRAILDACALPAGPIIRHYPRRFRLHLTELSRSASVPWAQDILRHTFASYAYEFSRDAAATAYEMGHTGTDIFFRHYRGLVPPGTGERFFALLPSRIRQENK